jgi:hypothetical protein
MRLTAPASLADHALCRRHAEDSDAQGHRECESDICRLALRERNYPHRFPVAESA